jgi:hypothetical protein
MNYWNLISIFCIGLSAFIAGSCFERGAKSLGYINLACALLNMIVIAGYIK